MRNPTPNAHDSKGFKDDESEAYRDMHQLRIQLSAKFGCLGFSVLIVGLVLYYIIASFF